ncbi:MAG: acyl-CoA thioesterase [Crocinitomicaceae bacterium]|nr:acyl-CoA thioesterase [Crocinitomicaceae bacterium]
MFTAETQVRVRYGETDQMGYCYYGNYAQFFEIGRVEALRSLGMSYRKMEEEGIMLPVLDYSVKYIKPALYDDLLTIRTTIPEIPKARIRFEYEIYNEKNELISKAETTLVFINKETMKPRSAPEEFVEKLVGDS